MEQISAMVEQIGREFKSKQAQIQPLMAELKSVRQVRRTLLLSIKSVLAQY